MVDGGGLRVGVVMTVWGLEVAAGGEAGEAGGGVEGSGGVWVSAVVGPAGASKVTLMRTLTT